MKKISFIILIILLTFIGCDNYLDVNKNVDAPDKVEGYLYLAGIQQAYQGIYWDNRAFDLLTQMQGTTSTYSAFGAHSYLGASDAAGEIWRVVYFLQGMNLENLINQSVAAEDWTLAGIGLAIKAYSWDLLTKTYGEVPMKQAFEAGRLSHDYDYQYDVYPQVREWAYKSIEYLKKTDDHNYGNKISANDFIYKGDKSKWIKFAYAVIVRNLASLSNKSDFKTKYAQELVDAAAQSFQTSDDDATVTIAGGSQSSPYADYNNYWGTARKNLSYTYFQHDYAIQVMTGTVPKYDQATGKKILKTIKNAYYPYELADKQIICDTLVKLTGHYDPRVTVKLGTTSDPNYNYITNADSVKAHKYYGGSFTSATGPVGTAPTYYGRLKTSEYIGDVHDGKGRWLYHDEAPYILTTCAEVKLCLAEAYYKMGDKVNALQAFKDAVKADLDFTAKHIKAPTAIGKPQGGDKVEKSLFVKLANEYIAGPYVNGLSSSDLTLSHIMMQKWVALYPWGASEAWVDMRKYNYDIQYTGDYPKKGNGWEEYSVQQKWDTDDSKVFKGLYLLPAQVQDRGGKYDITTNGGSPAYRMRPRYNSEYMWNKASLGILTPISGTADNYQTSKPWFVYPGDMPKTIN